MTALSDRARSLAKQEDGWSQGWAASLLRREFPGIPAQVRANAMTRARHPEILQRYYTKQKQKRKEAK